MPASMSRPSLPPLSFTAFSKTSAVEAKPLQLRHYVTLASLTLYSIAPGATQSPCAVQRWPRRPAPSWPVPTPVDYAHPQSPKPSQSLSADVRSLPGVCTLSHSPVPRLSSAAASVGSTGNDFLKLAIAPSRSPVLASDNASRSYHAAGEFRFSAHAFPYSSAASCS